eukprot:3745626-Rhodomonas_salina.2
MWLLGLGFVCHKDRGGQGSSTPSGRWRSRLFLDLRACFREGQDVPEMIGGKVDLYQPSTKRGSSGAHSFEDLERQRGGACIRVHESNFNPAKSD